MAVKVKEHTHLRTCAVKRLGLGESLSYFVIGLISLFYTLILKPFIYILISVTR